MANESASETIPQIGKRNNYSTPFELFVPNNTFLQGEYSMKLERKLREVKIMLGNAGKDSLESLIMIDALQRLGIDYHFHEEILDILHTRFLDYRNCGFLKDDLFEVSTCFRLLRQQGYDVSIEYFNNFINKEGKFKCEVSKDVRGLMSLYEASQLSMKGEEIIDEAADSSAQFLNELMPYLNHHQARVVSSTLQHPYHKTLQSLLPKNVLGEGQNRWVNVLQELAKMEFNMVQSLHQKEVLQVFTWWKETGLAEELKFARDQPLKWYMWAMATLTNPSLSEVRVQLTKPISFVYLIDDIYDVFGTPEELSLFTEAINRWELAALEQLPDYMKICFKALHDATNEIAYKIQRKHGWNPIDSLRKEWACLCNAFLVESKWFASKNLPKAEDYLKNAIISSGVHVVLTHMYFLLGEGNEKDSDKILNAKSGLMNSTATILRLWDDLGSAKDEDQDGHDGSYVECYMNEHKGCTLESARRHVMHMISESWKSLNKECLSPKTFSATFRKGCLNSARMVSLMYGYDDKHTLPLLEEYMKSMLYGPV